MKKLVLFISSLIFFLGCFVCFGLDSFADGENYPTAGVTIELTNSYNVTTTYTWNGFQLESIYPIVFYKDATSTAIFPVSPLAYGHSRAYRKVVTSYNTPDTPELVYGDWSSINWTSYSLDGNTYYYSSDGFNIGPWNGQISNFHYSVSNVIVFNSLDSACNYLLDPTSSDNLDNIYDDIGKDIVQDSLIPDIDWGSNGSPLSSGGAPDTYNIPAPQFNISYDSNGNVMHSITFTNFEYDSRRQDGKYGLVLSASWATFDDFSLVHTGSLFDTTYTVTYGSAILDEPVFDIFDVPEKVTDIQYCPQSLNFNQNTISLNAFNSMISNNPVNTRVVNVPASEPNDILENQFRDFLSKVNCPYNYLVFSCFYYKPNGDGTYSFGPTTTGAFYPPNQGAVYSAGRFNGQDGSMSPGSGGGAGGNGGNWNNNWGNGNTNINLDYGSNVDPQQLVNNMNSLLGFIGNVPNFVTQLFSFLPEWLIIFIAVSIGLMVAIGVVKLFLG